MICIVHTGNRAHVSIKPSSDQTSFTLQSNPPAIRPLLCFNQTLQRSDLFYVAIKPSSDQTSFMFQSNPPAIRPLLCLGGEQRLRYQEQDSFARKYRSDRRFIKMLGKYMSTFSRKNEFTITRLQSRKQQSRHMNSMDVKTI